jgi:hypothetical protein
MAARQQAQLGAVQETLFITLAARAAESQRKHPVLRDPRAVELLRSIDYDAAKYGAGAGGFVTVLRTAILDFWVRGFLAAHPGGTVVELGTGLNTRFERVDNGRVHWLDLDLPVALDTYPSRAFEQQHRLAARKGMDARWAWACDDPRSLERSGLEVRQSATLTRPPRDMRAGLPARYRYLVPLADPLLGKLMTLTLFRASSPAAADQAGKARAPGVA